MLLRSSGWLGPFACVSRLSDNGKEREKEKKKSENGKEKKEEKESEKGQGEIAEEEGKIAEGRKRNFIVRIR